MSELDHAYPIADGKIEVYRRDGHLRLEGVLSPETLADYGAEFTSVVRGLDEARMREQYRTDYGPEFAESLSGVVARRAAAEPTSTYERSFTQRLNLWRFSRRIERFVRSSRLARIAAELMGVEGVRIYHDQALYKEAGGGHTPWHVDQFYWPLASDKTVTLWIPLQAVSLAMGPVAFARGSHRSEVRDMGSRLTISDESEAMLAEAMADFEVDESTFALGDVSFHSGWTCHRAGPNQTTRTRGAFTIIYMDRDSRVLEPQHPNHRIDARLWLPGVPVGEVAASPLNPIVFER